ncbi:MAG: SRPBCC family protein [Solirubrobacteraceae bacterium]
MNPLRTAAATAVAPGAPEEIWALVSDPARFVSWAALTREVVRWDEPLGLGGSYVERNIVAGPLTALNTFTVVEHDPPRRAVHRVTGSALASEMWFFVVLGPAGDGTQVTAGLRYRAAFGRAGDALVSALVAPRLRRGFRETVDNIALVARRDEIGRRSSAARSRPIPGPEATTTEV